MADLASPMPVETEKAGAYLHDRSNRPKPPARDRQVLMTWLFPLLVAGAFALAMVAFAFQARASWESHRDWVVPVTVPLLAVGGLAFGHLLARREWNPLLPALLLMGCIVFLAGYDVWLDETDASAGTRDAVAIVTGIFLGLTVVFSLVALAWVEWKRPAKAPTPEA